MNQITLNKDIQEDICQKLKDYFEAELDSELGQFEASFLLDFISEKIGPYFYNQGIQDAQALLASKFEDIHHALYEIEKMP